MSSVQIFTGPPRSGKTRTLINTLLPAVKANRCTELLILVPSNLKGEEIRETLLAEDGISGFLGLQILTFLDLTLSAFQDSRLPGRVHTPLARRWMIQAILLNLPSGPLDAVKETPGFVDLADELIRTLKEGGISPEEFHTITPASEAALKLLEISKLYGEYENRRRKRNLLDREDLFDLAAEQLNRSQDGSFSRLRRVVVTGFYDFTPLQLKLLASLSGLPNMESLSITLTHTSGTGPAARFTQRTLDRLLGIFPDAKVRPLDHGENPRNRPLHYLVRNFLTASHEGRRIPSRNSIRILNTPGRYREVEEIARTIRGLMQDKKYRFSDFGLAFRNLNDYQEEVREIFRFYKIPNRMTSGLPLGSNPLVQAVMGILEVLRSGYRRDPLVRLLRSHYIRFAPLSRSPISAERIDILSREAMIRGGKDEWRSRIKSRRELLNDRLQRLESGVMESEDIEKRQEKIKELKKKIDHYRKCSGIMEDLFSLLDSFPSRASLSGFVEHLDKMTGRFHIEQQIYASEDPGLISRDQAALRGFQDLLQQMVQDHETIYSGREILLSEFIRILQVTLSDASYSPAPPGEDAVLVTDALGMRDLHRPVVFVGGLVEESFPRTHPPNPIFGEPDRIRLNRSLDLPAGRHGADRWVPLAAHWREEEDILFLLSAEAATELLFLTYPRTDSQGRDLLASRYIDRVRSLFDEGSIRESAMTLRDTLPDRDRIFRSKELLEYTFRALHRPLSQEPAAPALFNQLLGSRGPEVRNVLHGLSVNRARDRGDGAYGGLLGDDAAALLRKEEKPFSATALESYGACPFKYFCERELRVEPVEEVEDEMGALDIGSLYHRILERFYRKSAGVITRDNLEEKRRLMHGIIDSELSRAEYKGVPGHQKIWEIRKAEVHQILNLFLDREASDFEKHGETPVHFEASFGIAPSGFHDPLSTPAPLTLPSKSGPIRMMGKVDRIDIGASHGKPVFSIVDYKSGKHAAGPAAILRGESLQLPVYAQWVKNALSDQRTLRRGCFYLLKKGVRKCQIPTKNESGEEFWEITRKYIQDYVESIRSAKFPVTEKKCPDYCRLTHVCRIREG